MPLPDLQAALMHSIFGRDESGVSPNLTNVRRLSIYRNNVYTTLTNALKEIYPVILRLVDAPFFEYAAVNYIDRYPSTSGDLNDYGADFADFLSGYQPAAQLPYLPDIARLELCCHHAYLAADDPVLDLQKLSEVPAERHCDLHFRLNRSSRLLQSAWPVDEIWRVNQDEYPGDRSVDLSRGGTALVIQRLGDEILLMPLNNAEWSLLSAMASDQTLDEAFKATLESDPGADCGALLQKFVSWGTIVDFCNSEANRS